MEIIKPGKVRRVKLECPECGCEFVCVVLSGATVTEEPVGDERYITRVTNVSKEAAEHIKALGADTSISLMIDGKYPERFYMGNTGMLIAYKAHDGKLYE